MRHVYAPLHGRLPPEGLALVERIATSGPWEPWRWCVVDVRSRRICFGPHTYRRARAWADIGVPDDYA